MSGSALQLAMKGKDPAKGEKRERESVRIESWSAEVITDFLRGRLIDGGGYDLNRVEGKQAQKRSKKAGEQQ